MTVHCWQCGHNYPKEAAFNIPLFNNPGSRATIRWCFDCANKQLVFSDFAIIKKDVVNLLRIYNKKLSEDLRLVIKDYHQHLGENISFLKRIKELK